MNSSARILLLRHGQSTWNAERRWQGLADPPLTQLGEDQATQAGNALVNQSIDRIYSSDLQRAARTAQIISEILGIEQSSSDIDLRERDVGDWSGLSTMEIEKRWPEVKELRAAGKIVHPHGANNQGYERRCVNIIDKLCSDNQTTLIISHGGFIRTIERELSGIATEKISNLSGRWIYRSGDELILGDFFTTEFFDEGSTNVL